MKEFLYMGLGLCNAVLCLKVCPVVEGVPLTTKYTYFKKPRAKLTLSTGWIYAAELDTDPDNGEINRLAHANANPIRPTIGELYTELMLLERAAKTEYEMHRAAKKENLDKVLNECLGPIKRAMRKTNPQGKAAILALVVNKLNS